MLSVHGECHFISICYGQLSMAQNCDIPPNIPYGKDTFDIDVLMPFCAGAKTLFVSSYGRERALGK